MHGAGNRLSAAPALTARRGPAATPALNGNGQRRSLAAPKPVKAAKAATSSAMEVLPLDGDDLDF